MNNSNKDQGIGSIVGYCFFDSKNIFGILFQDKEFFNLELHSNDKISIPSSNIECDIYYKNNVKKCFLDNLEHIGSVDNYLNYHSVTYRIKKLVLTNKNKNISIDETFYKVEVDIPSLKYLVSDINESILSVKSKNLLVNTDDLIIYKDDLLDISLLYEFSQAFDINSISYLAIPKIIIKKLHTSSINLNRNDWYEIIDKLINVLSLLSAIVLSYRNVIFIGVNGRVDEYKANIYSEKHGSFPFVDFLYLKKLFAFIFPKYSDYKNIIEKYLYIFEHKDLIPSLTFLTLVNCIENLSRVIFQNANDEKRYYDVNRFEMLLDCYRKNIGRYSKKGILNKDHANSLIQTFEYSNDHPIRKNLENVFSYVGDDIQLEGKENCSKFIDNVIKYRNILSHPSEEFCEEDKLKEYNNFLFFIFRFAFFKNIGLDVENLKKNLLYHYGLLTSYPTID